MHRVSLRLWRKDRQRNYFDANIANVAIFTATSFRSLSDLINLPVTLVSTNSCLFYEKFSKGQLLKKRFWGLYRRVLCFSHCSESSKAGKPDPVIGLIDRLVSICTTNCYTTCGDDKYFILCRICVLVTITCMFLLCLCLFAEFVQMVPVHLNRLDRKFLCYSSSLRLRNREFRSSFMLEM